MRQTLHILVVYLCCFLVGCTSMQETALKSPFAALSNAFGDDDEKTAAKDEDRDADESTQLISSRVTISGMTTPLIEGVGLVTGLDGTGGDVPPSTYRRMMLEEMKKRRVENPQKVLQSPSTAVVVIRAYLPPLAQKGDTLDIEVILPPGSEATSLRGGWLLPTRMFEQGFVAGHGQIRDDEAAVASGPILLSLGDDTDLKDAGIVRKGSIPGGAKYIGDNRTISLILRSDYRSARNAKRIADRVGMRFHGFDEYHVRESLAEAKTDSRIELKIPEVYQNNIPRFLKVVKRVAASETPIETRIRMERLRENLLDPVKSEEAALQLEAIGKDSIPVLRDGLESKNLLCRFQAGSALAYLGDDSGVAALAEAAESNRALRVWALLAMSSLSGGEAISELVGLLDAESIETRYGAVRALTTVDEHHPSVEGFPLSDRAVLRVLQSAGTPVVHLTKSQKSEITLFGADQEFVLPLVARAGSRIMVVGKPGDRSIRVSKFAPGEEDETRTVTPMIADVVRAAAELGASYPDLVGLILEAEKQGNLPGSIAIDALPKGGRAYVGGAFSTGPRSNESDSELEPLEELDSYDDSFEASDEAESSEQMLDQTAPQQSSPKYHEMTTNAAENAATSPSPGYSTEITTSGAAPANSAAGTSELPPAQGESALVR